ncbi:MAG: fatty-acid oxidation protein subunit alpha [Stigonema ocellatum SAG 48.90 = DSM 106950]|nr:fatty-acid oxidation protein subunit alpha [Stigonema ocellatum SAG 48.90 = DSM 106950]
MPAKDFYHDTVVQALINDGWEINDDPLLFSYGGRELYVDLGAERTAIAAQKANLKIAVEIKLLVFDEEQRSIVQWIL